MASFGIELGFDWNIVEEQGRRHLQEGLCIQLPYSGMTSYFRVVKVGDPVGVNIYDITCDLNDPVCADPPRSLAAGTIDFRSADGNGPDSPFGDTKIVLPTGPSPIKLDSVTFNGRFPAWNLDPPLRVITAGKFTFKASLVVKEGSETRLFVVDPEMETGPGG
jgi:hypothetical protein